jgi:single-strand DNA-binding protein
MNKVIIIGRLTADPELRQSQNGTASCRFNVAVNRKFKNQNGEYDSDFISCVAFKQTAEFISRYFTKGKMIALEGTLRTGSYKDRNHQDVTHYTTDVFVENVEFCGDKGNNQNQPAPSAAQNVVQQAQTQGIDTSQYGNLSDFEEILSDGPTPF